MSVASREAVRSRQDPGFGEAIVPEDNARSAVRLSEDDHAVLDALLARHLRYDFGYGYIARRNPSAASNAAAWRRRLCRPLVLLAVICALFSQFGRPALGLNLTAP